MGCLIRGPVGSAQLYPEIARPQQFENWLQAGLRQDMNAFGKHALPFQKSVVIGNNGHWKRTYYRCEACNSRG